MGDLQTVQASIKWNAKTLAVDFDPSESLELLKAQIFSLTGVPIERQKLMAKAKLIRCDEDLQSACKSAGSGGVKFMLMGTSEGPGSSVAQPVKNTVFIEDLTPAQQAQLYKEKRVEPLPNGITNLGNTCYLAAVLQLLRPVKELTKIITLDTKNTNASNSNKSNNMVNPINNMNSLGFSDVLAASGSGGSLRRLALAIKDFYHQWSNTVESLPPILLVPALREAFPQFSRRSPSASGVEGGIPMQQDAEECLQCLFLALGENLPCIVPSSMVSDVDLPYCSANHKRNILDALFSIDLQIQTIKTSPNGLEERSEQIETHRKFTCFLGTPQKPVNTLEEGLAFSFGEEIIPSDINGGVNIERMTKIKSLSMYLIVHFMRFEWKVGGGPADKAKICKSVKFGQTLDTYLYCTEELQETLKIGRAVVALRKENEVENSSLNVNEKNIKIKDEQTTDESLQGCGEHEIQAVKNNLISDEKCEEINKSDENDHKNGLENNNDKTNAGGNKCVGTAYPTGVFKLCSVVTHQGRYADSGHYVGWSRNENPFAELEEESEHRIGKKSKMKNPLDIWYKFDDDKVTEMPWETIDISGGRSDYHVAYLLLLKHVLIYPTAKELEDIKKTPSKKFKSLVKDDK